MWHVCAAANDREEAAPVPPCRGCPVRPEDLRPLLSPRGIAVVGASPDLQKFSGRIVPALAAGRYSGAIYPVNPGHRQVAGMTCYARLAEVPDPCDLAIVAVPAASVVDVVREAADRGIGAAAVLSAGFEEVGGDGQARADALRALAGRIRIYGPNCPGLWQVRDGVVYTFSAQFDPDQLRPGPVGLVTQGGALGRAVLDAMPDGLGFSYWFSTGNEADLDAGDFVGYLAQDPGTTVIAAMVEGFRDGRRFLEAVARCRTAGKPVALLKVGRSPAGSLAARRHTGAHNGRPEVAQALLRRSGCLPAADVDALTHLVHLLARYPAPGAGGPGVCSISGGAGALLADALTGAGIPPPPLAPDTVRDLAALLPPIAAAGNPTDLTTAALGDPALAETAVERMAADPSVSVVLFPLPHRLDGFDAAVARRLARIADHRPLAVVAFSPQFPREPAAAILAEAGVPVLPGAGRAAAAIAGWLRARDAAERPPYHPLHAPIAEAFDCPPVAAGWTESALPVYRFRGTGWTAALPFEVRCSVMADPAFGPVVGVVLASGARRRMRATFRLAPLDLAEARRTVVELLAGSRSAPGPEEVEAAAAAVVAATAPLAAGVR